MITNKIVTALAIGAFAIGVTEFTPMGLLPVIADDLNVSIPKAGWLVSAYAFGVLVGAPIMTLGTTRLSRRTLLILLMAIFTIGNLLSAMATTFPMLMMARLLTSMCHGAFFGVGAIVAARAAPHGQQASAVAAMFTGLTLANIVGVPFASWLGIEVGWRLIFAGIAAFGLVAMAALRFCLPAGGADQVCNTTNELRVFLRPKVLIAILLTVIGSSALFTVFTYIVPILQIETGISTELVSVTLVIFGIGMAVGNWIGGRCSDNSIDRTLIVTFLTLIVVLSLFSIGMRWYGLTLGMVFIWGAASFALVPPLQMRTMAAAHEAPNLASAVNIGAFNAGNAVGALLGGAVISLGWGYPAVSLAGAVMAVTGLTLLLVMRRSARGDASVCISTH